MPGLVPGIHVFAASALRKTWMAGINPVMTDEGGMTANWPSLRGAIATKQSSSRFVAFSIAALAITE
jgi:hypothetical protein